MKSPLNYLGGKSKLAAKILPLIPDHQCYVEPFAGAAWVFFAKEPSPVEVLNDADGELVNFWRVVQHHLQPFIEYFKFAVVSRKLFDLEKIKRPETLTDIQRAARYYYLQRMAFGGRTGNRHFGASTTSNPGLNLATMSETLLETHWRLQKVFVENLDALACISRYDRPTTFFYIDPPYWGGFNDYAVPFPAERFQELADVLSGIKGEFLLSLGDCPEVRGIFGRFRIRTVTLTYSAANGRTSAGSRGEVRKELLITST